MIKALLQAACLTFSPVLLAAAANADKTPCELPKHEIPAAQLLVRAGKCLDQQNLPRAVTLYHAGVIRMAALGALENPPGDMTTLLGATRLVLDAPVLGWASGDVPTWISLAGDALAWDERTPFDEGTRRARQAAVTDAAWQDIRQARQMALRKTINELRMQRAQVYLQREAAGQPVRDRSWTPERAAAAKAGQAAEAQAGGHEHDHDHSPPEARTKTP